MQAITKLDMTLLQREVKDADIEAAKRDFETLWPHVDSVMNLGYRQKDLMYALIDHFGQDLTQRFYSACAMVSLCSGKAHASKEMMNYALIVHSFAPHLNN